MKAKRERRIDRNNYDPKRVLEIVREQVDYASEFPALGRDELLRLLEESAHAYAILRSDARLMWNTLQSSRDVISDKVISRRLW